MRFNFRFFASGKPATNPAFRWLAAGGALNSAGMQGEQVVIGLLVYQFTGSSAWVGISLALFFAPMLLVGVPAGALADRYDRRRLLLFTEVALFALLFVFATLLLSGKVTLTTALLMSVLSGALRALHHPARLSLAGDIGGRGDIVAALGMLGVVSRCGQLLGAIAAGVAAELTGAGSAYLLLAAGHLLAVGCFFRISSQQPAINTVQSETMGEAIGAYLRQLSVGGTVLFLIAFASIVEIFGFSFATALPEIAVDRLSLDAAGLGMMHASRATGGLCGALLLSLMVFNRLGSFFLCVMIGFGVALLVLALAPQLYTVLIAIALVAGFASATDILVQAMLQLSVPDHLRGRSMGAWVVALGMGPFGHLELGILISWFGTAIALGINGVILVLTGLLALAFCRTVTLIRSRS